MKVTQQQVEELQGYFCPFGFLDLKAAIAHGMAADLSLLDVFEVIEADRESRGLDNFSKMDPVYCVLEHILQMARNEIDDVLGYDFINDFRGGLEFHTCGNFMCSSYDFSDEAKDQLTERLDNADSEQLRELRDNSFVRTFLDEVEIDITEPE